jgi:hypothetical protein
LLFLEDINKFDVIVKSKLPYTCISTSDLSVCQQGIVFDNEGKETFHITPLALYSQYTKNIIITIAPLSRRYDSDWSSDGKHIHNALYYYEKHMDYCDCKFHECDTCFSKWDELDEVYNHVRIWIQRIQKYVKRFPNYTTTYVDLPK